MKVVLRAGLRCGLVFALWTSLTGLAQDWRVDRAAAPAIVNDVSQLANATFVPAPAGQFFVFGEFTHINGLAAPGLARLGADGRLDPAYATDLSTRERIYALAPLGDGRAVAVTGPAAQIAATTPPSGGGGTTSNGTIVVGGIPAGGSGTVAAVSYVATIIRVRADGKRDTSFTPLPCDSFPKLTTTPDGRVIVWGNFRSLGGAPRNGLARLNADGTLDSSFAPSLSAAPLGVSALAPGADGSVVLSGVAFDSRTPVTYVFRRLAADGSIDGRFAPTNPGRTFSLLALQPDGSVLAGVSTGVFAPLDPPSLVQGGAPEIPIIVGARSSLIRYSSGGALDRTYAPQISGLKSVTRIEPLSGGRLAVAATVGPDNMSYGGPAVFTLGVNGQVLQDWRKVPGAREGQQLLAVQPDGRLLVLQGTLVVASSYYPVPYDPAASTISVIMPVFLGPTLVDHVLALSPPDASAAPTTPLTALPTTIVQRNAVIVSRLEADAAGRVLAVGSFTQIDGQLRPGLARFLPSGVLDLAFAPDAGELVLAPSDGRLIFRRTTVGPVDPSDGFHRYVTQIVRLQDDGRVDPTFAFPTALDAANTNWLLAAPDGRLLISAFDSGDSREENLKLIWLGADGRRLATLPTVFTGFTRIILIPADATGVALPIESVPAHFPIGPGRSNILDAAQLLADGRLLVTGAFSRVNGVARSTLARLNADGSLDSAYAPLFSGIPGLNIATLGYQNTALLLGDGRALAFGNSSSGGRLQPVAVRFRADGALDGTFVPPPDTIGVGTRVLADGSFFYSGRRFDAEGWPDLNFRPGLALGTDVGHAWAAAITPDGRIWLGGAFDMANSQPCAGLARFTARDFPGIVVLPTSQRIAAGRDAYIQAAVGTTQAATFRWTRDGVTIPGATSTKLRLPAVRASDGGAYRVIVTFGSQTLVSDPSNLTVAPNTSRLTNFSARSIVSPTAPPQIAGVVTAATTPRAVLLRAIGRGVPGNSGAPLLGTPVLTLYENGRLLAENRGGATAESVLTLASSLGAFALVPSTTPGVPVASLGAALTPILGSANYTAVTTSGDGTTGLSLFEFYDTASDGAPSLVRNLAIRGNTAPGAGVLTAGFVIAGNGPMRLLVRAVGPTLAAFGLSGVVTDPRLDIFASGAGAFATNSGWGNDATLAEAARQAGAFALPANSRDAAVLLTLEPGPYTAQLASASGASAIGMIEIYVLDN